MNLDRAFAGLLFAASAGCVLATAGCKAYPTWTPVPVDYGCDLDDAYEQHVLYLFDDVSPENCATTTPSPPGCPGWTASDGSAGAVMTGAVVPIPDGARCGSSAAMLITADKNNEWGSLFGIIGFGRQNATGQEGLSFWARSTNNTNTAFTVQFNDSNTGCLVDPGDGGVCPMPPSNCITYPAADGGTGVGTTDGTGMIIPGSVTTAPEPDQCGNPYSAIVTATNLWRFYTIPFTAFHQEALPNRVPNAKLTDTGSLAGTGLIPSDLLTLVFRMPKAMRTELWIDDVGFYRKAGTGGDGGVDAPQM
jgi:hypothetical protein